MEVNPIEISRINSEGAILKKNVIVILFTFSDMAKEIAFFLLSE
jgi:hypothetical protein